MEKGKLRAMERESKSTDFESRPYKRGSDRDFDQLRLAAQLVVLQEQRLREEAERRVTDTAIEKEIFNPNWELKQG